MRRKRFYENHDQVVQKIAGQLGLHSSEVNYILQQFFAGRGVAKLMAQKKRIRIPGYGMFKMSIQRARKEGRKNRNRRIRLRKRQKAMGERKKFLLTINK